MARTGGAVTRRPPRGGSADEEPSRESRRQDLEGEAIPIPGATDGLEQWNG